MKSSFMVHRAVLVIAILAVLGVSSPDLCASTETRPPRDIVRTYYIAAKAVTWDYAPRGRDLIDVRQTPALPKNSIHTLGRGTQSVAEGEGSDYRHFPRVVVKPIVATLSSVHAGGNALAISLRKSIARMARLFWEKLLTRTT